MKRIKVGALASKITLLTVTMFTVLGVVVASKIQLASTQTKVFWMPYCPYGQEAVRNILSNSEGKRIADLIEFYYIAKEHSESSDSAKAIAQTSLVKVQSNPGCKYNANAHPDFGKFSSLHGRRETEESTRQVVVFNRWRSSFGAYLGAFLSDPDGDWQTRAAKAGIPAEELNDLVNSSTGAKWFSENIRQAREKDVTLSPTLIVNSKVLPKFPSTQEELRAVLCSSGILKDNCQGILCSVKSPCPEKLGYVGQCNREKCVYSIAPRRADAVAAYLIVPENCVPSEEFPVGDAIKGWSSYLNLTRLSLADARAQELLKGSKVSAFPVLVIDGVVAQREWGSQCIKELNLAAHDTRLLVSLEYKSSPFVTYADIIRDQTGLRVMPNHYAGALLLHRIGKLNAAAKSYRLALVENPKDHRAWNNLGAILYDSQAMKQSGGAMFQRAALLNASYEPALINILRFQTDKNDLRGIVAVKERLGWMAIEKKRWKEAAALFGQVVGDKQWEFSARKGLAFIAVQEARPDDALKELERCLEINPQPDGDFANLLAGVYFRLSDPSKAVEWYEIAVAVPAPSDQAYPNLCYLLYTAGQWDKLLFFSSKAFDIHPKNASFGFYKAQALTHLNRSEAAIELFTQLGQISEEAAFRSSYELATLYRSKNEKVAATRYASQFVRTVAIQRQPAMRDECMEVGNLAVQFGDNRLAAEAFQQVLRAKPSDVTAHKRLADCYRNLGQPDLSQKHLILARQFGGDVE